MEIITYNETLKKNVPENYEITLLVEQDDLLKGTRRNTKTNKESVLVGRKLNDQKIMFLEFSKDQLETKTYLGQISNNTIFGKWRDTTDVDIKRLLSFEIEPIEPLRTYLSNSEMTKTNNYISEDNIKHRINTTTNSLNYDQTKLLNKVYKK